MWSRPAVALVILASNSLVIAAAPSRPSLAEKAIFTVALTGGAKMSNKLKSALEGDLDGSGKVELSVDLDNRQICYDFTLANVDTPLMAHIHRGTEATDGPSVVTLFTGPGADLADCVPWTNKWLAKIVSNPSDFYVNLYTTEFPDGALRGQLSG
jgi:hypothetical protein